MSKRWKTVFALKIPIRREANALGLNTVDIADRLDTVVSELTLVDAAIHGSDIEGPALFGFYSVLRRQMDEITAIRNAINPRVMRRP